MKKYAILFLILGLVFNACESNNKPAENLPEGYHAVKVQEYMDAGQYTYMRVAENDKDYWIAVPKMSVKEGDILYYSKSLEMKKFNSKTLNRTFDSVLFVDDISTSSPASSGQPQMGSQPSSHPKVTSDKRENLKVEPVKGGTTIAQVYSNKDALNGKTVKIRGMVTKYNGDIMGMNWIHIQDGTQSGNSYDLAVTSKDKAEMGKLVVVEGKVSLNKDFGSGYAYDVILQDAKVTME